MKKFHFGHCVLGAIVAVGVLVLLGVPARGFVVLFAVAACPLMMVLMMRTMAHDGDRSSERADSPAS